MMRNLGGSNQYQHSGMSPRARPNMGYTLISFIVGVLFYIALVPKENQYTFLFEQTALKLEPLSSYISYLVILSIRT